MPQRVHNRPALERRRRALRVRATPAEKRLWHVLRRRQLDGLRFRRQHSVLGYVLDFYCAAVGLAVEVDGSVHADPARAAYDTRRQRDLEQLSRRVLRVSNADVLERLDLVVEAMRQVARKEIHLPPQMRREDARSRGRDDECRVRSLHTRRLARH